MINELSQNPEHADHLLSVFWSCDREGWNKIYKPFNKHSDDLKKLKIECSKKNKEQAFMLSIQNKQSIKAVQHGRISSKK